jgi:LacI family transcriptional regulator, gluconate utilization system Gnt-I transcriptional repressor
MQRVTMNDVARVADVSPSTVSLYLRKPTLVSPEMGEKIAQAVEELAYVPSLVAGGLAAAGSRVVSIIVPSVRNAFFADTVAALQDALEPSGLQLMLGHTEYSLAREEALVRAALSWSPAAIVLVGLEHSRATKRLLLAADIPVFEVWDQSQNPIDTAVGFYPREVGIAAATHLIERGRTRLCFLGARMGEDHRAQQRAAGFVRGVADRGLSEPPVLNDPGNASTEAGVRLLGEALASHPELDGIGCSNDLIALGVLFECQRRAIAVPDRIAVIGFGDLVFSAGCVPPLTTIRPPGGEIGRKVGELIVARLNGAPRPEVPQSFDLGFSLQRRQST